MSGAVVSLVGRSSLKASSGGQVDDAAVVERATRLFLDALPRRRAFAEVAAALHMPPGDLLAVYARRCLQPRTHLRQARLAELHVDLMAGCFSSTAEALVRWGFSPASPDALADYRRRYGRWPDDILAEASQEAAIARGEPRPVLKGIRS